MNRTSVESMANVIGGGLAGSEAAWQIAQRGIPVTLWEMRPHRKSPAHTTDQLAELVCSNSLGSDLPDRAAGVLKRELRMMGSLIMCCADRTRVPAGGALAVDRERFSDLVSTSVAGHPNITIRREEVVNLPEGPVVVASGPLTSPRLAESIRRLVGEQYLYFYDALAPIVDASSIDTSKAFYASRYERGSSGDGDYINCPLNEAEYADFVAALVDAECFELRDFEVDDPRFFEGCLPIEQLAARGPKSLAYGPLRPVGITNPTTGERPYAVVQLRQDNLAGSLFNIVGFQTNLRWPEQKRIFRMIPGLQNAVFVRYGQMHRNTFINAPELIDATMQLRDRGDLFFAGQITGIEGYVGNAASGLLAGINMVNYLQQKELWTLPETTLLGALAHYVSHAEVKSFQPMKANFGLLPPLSTKTRGKQQRYRMYASRAITDLSEYLGRMGERDHGETSSFPAELLSNGQADE